MSLSSPFIIVDMKKKNKKDREIISKKNNALIKNPNVFNIVSSSTLCTFAEEANVEGGTLQTDAVRSATTDMVIKDRSKKQQNNYLKNNNFEFKLQ